MTTLPWDLPVEPPTPQSPKRPGASAALVLAVALVSSSLGVAGTYVALGRDQGAGAQDTPAGIVKVGDPVTRLPGGAGAAAAVAAALIPSIVKVDTRSRTGTGTGSGVIYSSDGYIITNDHVVSGSASLTVQLNTGEVVPARVVGTAAPFVDLAVLKIDRVGLKAAKFGSSYELKVGELAVAIGNPLGLEASVSAGVISGLHRNGEAGGARFMDAIQTDAQLQPGNSGGALANREAEVIGINTLVVGDPNLGTGLGLAISSEVVNSVAGQIIDTGSARLAFIGIEGEDGQDGKGVVVRTVTFGGPAELAGLQPGDIIRSLDGKDINSMDGLVSALLQRKAGDQVNLQVDRAGALRKVAVTLQVRRITQ